MKNVINYLIALSLLFAFSCEPGDESNELESNSSACGRHNGKILNVGPEGGCYYINDNGNKTYVSRSECHCQYDR